MYDKHLTLRTSPTWRTIPGYICGLPQASVMAVEVFPSNPEAVDVTEAFAGLLAQVIEDDFEVSEAENVPLAIATTLARATTRLQNWVYIPAAPQHVINAAGTTDDGRTIQIILPYWLPDATRVAYASCLRLWNRLSEGETFDDIVALRNQLSAEFSPYVAKGVNQFALIRGVTTLGINLIRLPGTALCLGTGARSRIVNSTLTDKTPFIGIQFARNKFHTASLLRMSGLPGAVNKVVSNSDEAIQGAKKFGYPIVVKPVDLDRGEGVAAHLMTESAIRSAFDTARELSPYVMIEKHIPGFTHRLTVADGEVISVRQRVPGGVTGDGKSTVKELVEEGQSTKWSRRWERTRGRAPVELDIEALDLLKEQGFDVNTILPSGIFQRLRRRDNINAGGQNLDIPLDSVDQDNIDLATSAAQILRLDIAGVDLISTDITKSWRETDAGICEVNGRPQLAARRAPELYHRLLSRLMGPEPHVPADLILCGDNSTERMALIEGLDTETSDQTITSREGLRSGGVCITDNFPNDYAAACAAAIRSDVVEIKCVLSLQDLLRLGSPLQTWSKISLFPAGLNAEEKRLLPNACALLGVQPKDLQILPQNR
jgi:cyanophycin synthetase